MQDRLVVVGNGMAGMRCVEELLALQKDQYDITVIGAEPYGNYNRIMLTPLLYGAKSVDDIMIHDFNWYQQRNIRLLCGPDKRVSAIDRDSRRVFCADGSSVAYERLLIATGSRSHRLPIPGSDVEGVIGFRDIADVEYMIDKANQHRQAVVLGGGLLGLEAANGLLQRGMQVTVVNRAGHILNKQLDSIAGRMLQDALEQKGIRFCLGQSIRQVSHDGKHITGVTLEDGFHLPTDLLVMATGITPNIELAADAGIRCERGILVDDRLLTSDPRIYAIGECVQHCGELFGLVAPVYEQAKVCAQQLAGHGEHAFQSLAPATVLKVSGIDLFSMGDFNGQEDCEEIVFLDRSQSLYRKIVLRENVIVGMLMYGDTRDSAWYQQLLRQRRNIGAIRDRLIFGRVEIQEAA